MERKKVSFEYVELRDSQFNFFFKSRETYEMEMFKPCQQECVDGLILVVHISWCKNTITWSKTLAGKINGICASLATNSSKKLIVSIQ